MPAFTSSSTRPNTALDAPLLSDPTMPAVQFLTGPDAIDVLRAPVEAAGGRLLSATPRNVQYRPGSDLIVKYAAEIVWPGRPQKRETIMAAAKVEGVHQGAVPVAAVVNGRRVEVGVWRWPFDPVLLGLSAAVTPRNVAELCGIADPTTLSIKVVAFRPTDRAVVRVSTPTETLYLKVVAPPEVAGLVGRHSAASAAGVPVPLVRDSFPELGIVVLEALAGPLLKDEIKAGRSLWPGPDQFNSLADQFARIDADLAAVPSRVRHAILHADMLRAVDDSHAGELDHLCAAFSSFDSDTEPQTIHGDLHEGQIVVDGRQIAGVLDLDDLGAGSPLEERANLLGFLRYRSVTLPALRPRITDYTDQLRQNSLTRHDRHDLDVATAGVLVGLATGPFRIQQPGWHDTVSTLIATAANLLAPPPRTAVSASQTNRPTNTPPPPEES